MKHFKPGTGLLALATLMFIACNDPSDNPPELTSGNTTQASNDTTTARTDTNTIAPKIADSPKSNAGPVAKKRLKASAGSVAASASKKYVKDRNGAYNNAEVLPSYKGGEAAITDYIDNNIQIPDAAAEDNKSGTVHVNFTIDEKGKVWNAKATGAKLGDDLDGEAVKVVSSMPDWKPGSINGKPVKVNLTLPVVFQTE